MGLEEDVHVKLYDLNGGAITGGLLTRITVTSAADLWWLPKMQSHLLWKANI